MRVGPRGQWFIICTDTKTGKVSYPLYDGFNTKTEAEYTCERMNAATSSNYIHTVTGRK